MGVLSFAIWKIGVTGLSPRRILGAVAISAAVLSFAGCGREAQPRLQARAVLNRVGDLRLLIVHPANEYMLDDAVGSICLYPGAGYRGLVDQKERVGNFEELKRRVGQLPRGSKLFYS